MSSPEINFLRNILLDECYLGLLTLCPEITEIENKLLELGAVGAHMSGSGPTVFGLFTDGNKAIEASEYFKEHGYVGRSFATRFYQPN